MIIIGGKEKRIVEKTRLGKTGMMVSRLGFGGIPIQRLSEVDAIAVVKRVLEHGITFLDTANGYSTSEERIGKAVQGKRKKVYIATKSGARNKDELEKHLALSLKRLDTDYIDLYQFHGVNDKKSLEKIFEPGGAYDAVVQARDKGIVKHIGITSHQIDVARKAVETDRFETLMFPFNFITDEAATQLLPLCRQHDVGFIVMKPLAGGMVDNARIAFKYLVQFKDAVAIPGIEKIAEIDEIVTYYQGEQVMTASEKKEMQEIKEGLGKHFCHRCDYCQPCTSGIPISMIMTAGSFYKRLPSERFFSDMIGGAMKKAESCVECGECEIRCPYGLPIRDKLKEQISWYNDLVKRYEKQKVASA
jgi:predicted aldo/keto reductase-like oxidoreductase